MTKRNVLSPSSVLQRSAGARKEWQRLLAITLPCLGLGSTACLSDISISDCAQRGDCGASHAGSGGSASIPGGGAGASAGAFGGSEPTRAGDAGAAGSGDNAGGPEAGGASLGGSAGAASGGTAAGTPGAGSAGTAAGTPEAGSAGTAGGEAGAGSGGMAGEGGDAGDGPIIPQTVLTPPCAQRPYSKTLKLFGEAPPYQWQSLSDGWNVAVDPADSSRATLSADQAPAGTTNVRLKLTDSLGHRTIKTLILQARDTCYFAFTTLEGTDSQLQLLDPLAETPAPRQLQHNQGVYDFQFSPDGQFLAYRHDADAAHPTGQHVALVTLSSLQERELNFQESAITAFSWSPDSSVLAVAFESNDVTYLGGVRAPTSNAAPIALVAKEAHVESELYWIGNSYVAFHAQLIPDFTNPGQFLPDPVYKRRTAFYSSLGQQGFDPPSGIDDATYYPDIHVQASDTGFFVITDQGPGFFFNQLNTTGWDAVSHFNAKFLAPSSRYSASNSGNATLRLFSADDGTLSPPSSTSKTGQECPMLLAWAQGTERIACVADVPNTPLTTKHGVIRIFDLQPNSDTLPMSELSGYCTDDSNLPVGVGSCSASQLNHYNYGTARAIGSARGFSASGRWLAFATSSTEQSENVLYLADLNKGFALTRNINFSVAGVQPSASSTELTFSPDEKLLLLRRGAVLSMHDLASETPQIVVSQDLPASQRCVENFAKQPDAWCGNTDRAAPLRWSESSKLWAFRSPGKLTVVNNTQFPAFETFPLNAADCAQQCTNQFAFQPPLPH